MEIFQTLIKRVDFLSSEFGRKFDAKYLVKKISEVEHFKSHKDYASKVKNQNKNINDDLIYNMFQNYRLLGYNVYVVPQKSSYPFLTLEKI